MLRDSEISLRKSIIIGMNALLFASFFLLDMTSISSSGIIIETGILFVIYCLTQRRIVFRFEPFHGKIILFSVFCLISSVWAWNPSSALSRGITVFETLVCVSIVLMIYRNEESADDFITSVLWSGLILVIYMTINYGIGNLMRMAQQAERLNTDIANPNMVSIWISFCVVIGFHRLINHKISIINFSVVVMIMYVGLLQSRTALFVMIIGIILTLYFKSTEYGAFYDKLFKFLLIMFVFLFVTYNVSQLPFFEGVNDRIRAMLGMTSIHKEGSSMLRRVFREIGFEQFLKTPIFGIGISSTPELTVKYTNHYTYLHNNYIDLLAGGGVVGFIIYYSTHYSMIKSLYKKRRKNKEIELSYIILIMLLVSDYGTVSYYKKYTYVILALCYHCVACSSREIEGVNTCL